MLKTEYERGFIAGIEQQKETKMNLDKYNGWSNRATWLVNIWFNPESKDDVYMAQATLEEAIDDLPDFLRDFVDTDINWEELLEHFNDDEETEEE